MAAAGTVPDFRRLGGKLSDIQGGLRDAGLDGWLLYDLRAHNMVAEALLEQGELSRRYFVLIPADGEPVAITHGIEQAPWASWPWQKRVYVGWRPLGEMLQSLLSGKRVAMEMSEEDAVPSVDLVPAGVVEMVRAAGAQVVSSADLLTRFYATWSPEDLASHRRSAAVLAQTTEATFTRLGRAIEHGEHVTEGIVSGWVRDHLAAHGVASDGDCSVAAGVNAANPHYDPVNGGAAFRRGDLILLDLWGRESPSSIFADQTWMGYLGGEVPDRAATLFGIIRDARDAAVSFLHEAWQAGRPIAGAEVDDVARRLITDRGYGEFFIHRTGHSIDRAVHGMGPNIDNLETRDTRRIVPGVGFSIEPGIYLPGEIGLRTEIDVYMSESGPEVTTPSPQREIRPLLAR